MITATKTGTEKNATVFARYWAEALRDPPPTRTRTKPSPRSKRSATPSRRPRSSYDTQKRLATEHAVLEDTGTRYCRLRGAAPRIGGLRRRAIPRSALLARREAIEQEIDQLKFQKAAMPADEYKKQLTALLLQLARPGGTGQIMSFEQATTGGIAGDAAQSALTGQSARRSWLARSRLATPASGFRDGGARGNWSSRELRACPCSVRF